MTFTIHVIAAHEFPLYDAIPTHFEVTSRLRIDAINGGLGGFHIQEEPVVPASIKDYNAAGDDTPTAWARDFDISRWGIFLAEAEGRAVGGAAVALGDNRPFPMDFCQGNDLAALVDIRVHPDARRQELEPPYSVTPPIGRANKDAKSWDLKRKASTFLPAISTSGKGAPWAPSIASGIAAALTLLTRQCCCGIWICDPRPYFHENSALTCGSPTVG